MATASLQSDSAWPHRAAVLLVCATFPLIFVGGLVTTYDAGMAVPDWPTTYGYNLFLYPWQTWLSGPFDLFIEHGHRLFGSLVGVLTILLVAAAFLFDRRAWYRQATVWALLLVIAQGVLGGMRVRMNERLWAQIHGCVGPAFFAFAVALAVWASRWWREEVATTLSNEAKSGTRKFQRLAFLTTMLAYVQLVIGSQLRHVNLGMDRTTFHAALMLHLLMAAALVAHIVMLSWRATAYGGVRKITRPAMALLLLIVAQLCLGASTWVLNYGWPNWLRGYAWSEGFVVGQQSMSQSLITTAHVAMGSLILGTALLVALCSLRLPAIAREPATARLPRTEALA